MSDMRSLIQAFDWRTSPLGDRTAWPISLNVVLDVMLSSKFAMCLGWGPDITLIYNDAYARFLGPRHPSALGCSIRDVWSEVWDEIEVPVRSALTGEAQFFEDMPATIIRGGEPEETWWTCAFSPVQDDNGQIAGMLNMAIETTAKILNETRLIAERERSAAREAELKRLNEDLESQVVARAEERSKIWSVSSELLSVIDLETGKFDRVNPAWQALGWAAHELEGRPYSDFVAADDLSSSAEAWEKVKAGNRILRFDNCYRHKDGSYRLLSWAAVPSQGKLYGSARDITAEKARSEELARAEDALRQAQKLEAIGQLTGGVAHDFNNLLTVILGSIDLLRRPGISEERRDRYVNAIAETADRASKLTGQLLAFARRQTLKPETFDCATSIEAVVAIVATLTGPKVELSTKLPAEPCFAHADRGQFDTAIINMCVNARDAMQSDGRLTIEVSAVPGVPAIRGHTSIAGNFVGVSITDTGTGISPGDVERIFEPFFTTKDTGKGTGLGLSQAIGFAKQSNGDIRVESTPGQGTRFTLYLPRVSADGVREVEDHVEEPLADGTGICVLVVEDNHSVGDFAVQALRELGYGTVLATNAAEALAILDKDRSRFDIVFSDVVMPGMSGLELGSEIRRLHHDLPVILTSGYSHVLAQKDRHEFELLHKPYSIEQLSRIFQKTILRQRRGTLID
jgi:PAS domain S-box-containing protein